MANSAIANPKQIGKPIGKDAWYPYYAGFSSEFAKTVLQRHPPLSGKHVLDQWNGGGTTTQVSDQLGMPSIGCDINPVMIVVAKARRLQAAVKESIVPLATQLLRTKDRETQSRGWASDPLAEWIAPSAVPSIRSLERAIRNHFIPETCSSNMVDAVCTPQFSDLAAYFYLILFRTARHLLSPFRTANPTWLRVPEKRQRLRPSSIAAENAFLSAVSETLEGIDCGMTAGTRTESLSTLLLGDSRCLPIESGTVGAILTSPPYLTRLDYAVSTGPELAILGQGRSEIRTLREKMIGTTVIVGAPESAETLGGYATWCLDKIRNHSSKASKSYYLKNTAQYLYSMKSSIVEAWRVLASDAPMSVVVQDSYYKDVHLDLPRIVCELGQANGLELVETHPFHVERHLGRVHPHHRKHCERTHRIESVVVMRKRSTKENRYAN